MNTFEMATQLKGKYREVFEKADLFGTLNGLEKDAYEDKLMNLYDLLIEAQHEEKPVEKIVGSNLESFCEVYFEDFEKKVWWKVLLERLFRVLCVLLVLEGCDIIFQLTDGKSVLQVESDISPLLFGLVLAFVLDSIVRVIVKPIIFKCRIKPIVYYLSIVVIWFGFIVGGVILMKDHAIQIPSFWMAVISGIYVVFYLIIRTIWRYKHFGRITKLDKKEKQVKKEFDQEVSDKYLEDASASAMASRFKRMNKKMLKKGKPALTQEAYAEKIRAEECKASVINKWMVLLFAAIVIIPMVTEILTNTIIDGLILGAVLFVVEFAIYRFTKKTNEDGSRVRLHILDECEKRQITVVEYAQILKEEKE